MCSWPCTAVLSQHVNKVSFLQMEYMIQAHNTVTYSAAGLEEALKRKDNIIRVRNAQISALWDELHTRQPWRNALKEDTPITMPEDASRNTSRALVMIGVNTVSALPF